MIKVHKLGVLCDIGSGGTPLRSNAAHYGGEIPWVKISDLETASGVVFNTEEKLTLAGLAAIRGRLFPAGTLLFAIYGSIGKMAFAGRELSTNQAILGLQVKTQEVLESRYLFHWLANQKSKLEADGQGIAQKNLSAAYLRGLEIALPSVAKQKEIVELLDKATALRAKRRATLAQLDELTQSVFLDMFGDPVRNPMGFPIRHLSEFYVSREEGTKCGPFGSALKKNELTDSGVPVWNMDNIDSCGRMVLPFRMWISKEKYRQLRAYAVKDGDVVISRAGTVGKMCVAQSGCDASIISTNLIRVRFGDGLLPTHFVSLMTYCKGRVGRLKTGPDGAFTHMNTGILDKLAFPYPPLDLQKRFASFVERIDEQRDHQRKQLAAFDALFASLQHRAFRGEL